MSGKMKNYVGKQINGWKVIDSSLTTDATHSQILLVEKVNGLDKGFIRATNASKFSSGHVPLSPAEHRKMELSKRPFHIKKVQSGFLVNLVLGGHCRNRIFKTKKQALVWAEKTREEYIQSGKVPKTKLQAKSKASDHVYERKVGNKTKYIFEFTFFLNGKKQRKNMTFDNLIDAKKYDKEFSQYFMKHHKFPTSIKTKSSNKSGHKYINFNKTTYYFEKTYKGRRYRKGFHTLSEALTYRNQWLTDHNLPIPD